MKTFTVVSVKENDSTYQPKISVVKAEDADDAESVASTTGYVVLVVFAGTREEF